MAISVRTMAKWISASALLLLAVTGAGTRRLDAQQDDPAAPRQRAPLTILQLNDVYSTVPIDGRGGLARVAALKQKIASEGRTTLMMLAGDFLSSSVESTIFKGEQMVAALNAAGLDMATLGNHEFDFGIDLLVQRMHEAKWQWVVSNVIDRATDQPVGGAAPYLVRSFGRFKLGVIGLCLTTEGIPPDKLQRVRLVDPLDAAATYVPVLKREGVDAIVALTHLTFEQDRALAERYPDIDVIVGGHEHFPITAVENRTFISKAGSDAKFVARIDLARQPSGMMERFFELIPITASLPEDAHTAEVVNSYESRLSAELNVVVATSPVPLDAATIRLRVSETNLGDLVADAMRAGADADVALVNSGGIRGDRVLPTGALTRRTLLEIHPFGNVLCKLAVSGSVILDALNSGVSKLPAAAGQFPQVSGMSFRVDPRGPPGDRVREARVNGQPLDPNKSYTIAIPDFILLGGDGYGMFGGQRVLISPQSGELMVTALERYLAGRPDFPSTPKGRIVIEQ
jgi:5'-nucleotidase